MSERILDNIERLGRLVIAILRARSPCLVFALGLVGLGVAGLQLNLLEIVAAFLADALGASTDWAEPGALEIGVCLCLILLGLGGGVHCVRSAMVGPYLEAQLPASIWVAHEPDRGDLADPQLPFKIDLDLHVGAKPVLLLSVRVRRYLDGLGCQHVGVAELFLDEAKVALRGDDLVTPPLLELGKHRLTFRGRFGAPLPHYWSNDAMAERGELDITYAFRGVDQKGEPTSATLLLSQHRPGLGPDELRPIAHLSDPPLLNDRILAAARWRRWISAAEARDALKWRPDERFVAAVMGRRPRTDRMTDGQIEAAKALHTKIAERRLSTEDAEQRAIGRFGRSGLWLVRILDWLGLVARSKTLF